MLRRRIEHPRSAVPRRIASGRQAKRQAGGSRRAKRFAGEAAARCRLRCAEGAAQARAQGRQARSGNPAPSRRYGVTSERSA